MLLNSLSSGIKQTAFITLDDLGGDQTLWLCITVKNIKKENKNYIEALLEQHYKPKHHN